METVTVTLEKDSDTLMQGEVKSLKSWQVERNRKLVCTLHLYYTPLLMKNSIIQAKRFYTIGDNFTGSKIGEPTKSRREAIARAEEIIKEYQETGKPNIELAIKNKFLYMETKKIIKAEVICQGTETEQDFINRVLVCA